MVAPLVGLVAISSCAPRSSNNYAGAAIGAAVAVATVATMRAVTGECWARCDQGQVCDRESGLCVDGECYPTCGWGQHCERFSGGLLCVPDPNAGIVTLPVQSTPARTTAPTNVATPTAPPAGSAAPQPPAAPATAPSTLDPSWTEEPAEPPAPEPSPPPWESGGAAEPAPGNWATPKD